MKNIKLLFLSLLLLVFSSCSDSGLFHSMWSMLPDYIDSFGGFMHAFFVIILIQFVIGLLVRLLLGNLDFIISIVLFFVILSAKDYGFFLTLLLFTVEGLVTWGLTFLYQLFKISRLRK